MDVGVHELAQRIINQSVSRDSIEPFKTVGHYRHVKVPFAFPGARVAGVEVALILHEHFTRGK